MKLLLIALSLTCLCAPAADKKKKPPDVEILELKVVKHGDRATLDGRIRVSGEKPLHRLVLHIDFIAAGNAVMATKQAPVDEDKLNPGEEATVHAETECPPKAFEYKIRAFHQGDRELNVGNAGPFPIQD